MDLTAWAVPWSVARESPASARSAKEVIILRRCGFERYPYGWRVTPKTRHVATPQLPGGSVLQFSKLRSSPFRDAVRTAVYSARYSYPLHPSRRRPRGPWQLE
jgi:hypothetical protein